MRKRRLLSQGVRKLNLPSNVFQEMERQLWHDARTMPGEGAFLYMPFTVLANKDGSARVVGGDDSLSLGFGDITMMGKNDDIVELVGVLFRRKLKQSNIHAKPGDTTFQLRSEWNEATHPLG